MHLVACARPTYAAQVYGPRATGIKVAHEIPRRSFRLKVREQGDWTAKVRVPPACNPPREKKKGELWRATPRTRAQCIKHARPACVRFFPWSRFSSRNSIYDFG